MDALAVGAAADFPLAIDHILRRMRTVHGATEVVTQLDDSGRLARATFAEVGERADRLGAALRRLGVQPGDRVGSLAWNTQDHLEVYYGVPCLGAVLHTMNLRLTAEQIAYTVNHARDRVILVDGSLVDQMLQVVPLLESVEHFVVMGDGDPRALPGGLAYEELLAAEAPGFGWPALDERSAAALCYTSGTTGDPKGVAYSHRTLAVHALAMSGYDVFRVAERDRVMAVVPMFHAMGWNLPYTCGVVGADMVMPGRFLQAPHLARLITQERVTYTSGVPTIFMDLLRHVAQTGADISTLETIVCGGTQVPPSLMREYERRHGVQVIQGWGMTEVLPGAAMSFDPPDAGEEERWRHREMAGRVSPFYEVRVVADDGTVLPADGESTGEFEIRGPMVAPRYFGEPPGSEERFHDGWLRTGDVGSLTTDGWMRITDRSKDVIKSGGEWISSVDLESALMAHPAVDEAAVIARPDERWSERPLACVVLNRDVSTAELREFLADRVAKWWLPDDFAFVEAIPRTSVGKFDKKVLRDQLAAGDLPVEHTASA
jgi:fatty-acyl-CoA synthase